VILVFSRLGRYLYAQTLKGVGMAMGVVVTLILLIDFVEQTRTVGSRVDVGALTLFQLTLLKTPRLLEDTLPFIFLFGVMYAMFQLNRRSELIAMRAAGLSAWRFLTPPVTLAVLAGVLATIAFNPVASSMNAGFENRRAELLRQDQPIGIVTEQDVWLKETEENRQVVIRAKGASADQEILTDATFFIYEPDLTGRMAFAERIDAARAQLQAGFWQLNEAVQLRPGQQPRSLSAISFPSSIDAESIFRRSVREATLSFWRLPAVIDASETAGFSSRVYETRFYFLMAKPLMMAAMAMIAAAVSLRLARLGGALPMAVLGGFGGFLLFFIDDLMTAISESGNLAAPLAAAAGPLTALLLTAAFIAQKEDG